MPQMRGLVALLTLTITPMATAQGDRIVTTIPSDGIHVMVLRAGNAASATVRRSDNTQQSIIIEGKPSGDSKGYHSPDPSWKETPANKWGLNFVSQRYGNSLVVSTTNEIEYIHHQYVVEEIIITVPRSMTVRLTPRKLSGDGRPDLSKP